MYRKTNVRKVLELIEANMSNSYISKVLKVSRNTIIETKDVLDNLKIPIIELLSKTDDEIYKILFPNKFKRERNYEIVDYNYVHNELKKKGVTLLLLWEEYKDRCESNNLKFCKYPTFTQNYEKYTSKRNYTSIIRRKPGEIIEVDWAGTTMKYFDSESNKDVTVYLFLACMPYSQKIFAYGTTSMDQTDWLTCHVKMFEFFGGVPLKIICDNLKTGVIEHPKHGDIILNDDYISLGEYYGIAIIPTGVRKPKEKASVEGSVGQVTNQIIAKLRNETFYTLEGLNQQIIKEIDLINDKPFQKREGSRNIVFNLEEKHLLKELPKIPYEVYRWVYNHKVIFNSHINFQNNWYSVPTNYIGSKVNIKYNNNYLYIYYNSTLIAKHKMFINNIKNQYRTDENHIPKEKQFEHVTYESLILEASKMGINVKIVCERLLLESKVKEQSIIYIKSILELKRIYENKIVDEACKLALENYQYPHYKEIIKYIKKNEIDTPKENKNVRGASYYGGNK